MKILVLCDNFIQINKFLEFSYIYLKYDFLICNNKKEKKITFLLRHLYYILKSNSINIFIKLYLQNKIKLKFTSLNSTQTEAWILTNKYDIGLHSMGVIYKQKIIDSFTYGILNSHIGILPEYRGRSVMEWSILNNSKVGITVFFIDSGIDTGEEIIVKKIFNISRFKTISDSKQYLFSLDAYMYDLALSSILDKNTRIINNISQGKRYYVMSNLLSTTVNKYLNGQ